jgi:SPP1 family predicted phage head-tail adaptor
MVCASGLDRRITIQEKTVTRGASGGVTETWATYKTVWASKQDSFAPLSKREFYDSNQFIGERTTEFTIRHDSGVKYEMRISYDGLLYNIEGLVEVGRKEGLKIICTAMED